MIPRRCQRLKCSEQRDGPCKTWNRCDWYVPAPCARSVETPVSHAVTCPTEEEEQTALCRLCEDSGIMMVHIPNEARRTARVGAALKRQGMRPGFPDNFFPYARLGRHGLFIELKRARKSASRVSPEQTEWIGRLRAAGYRAEICYGANEAMAVVREYMAEQK